MSDWQTLNFDELAKSRPTKFLRKKSQITDLFAAIGTWNQKIEDACKYIWLTYDIYNATGAELDRFGEYVDEPRNGDNDDTYRNRILTAKYIADASGTAPGIYRAANLFTSSTKMSIIERYYASYNLHFYDDVIIPADISTQLDKVTAAGISAHATFSRGVGDSFWFAGITDKVSVIGVNGSADTAVGVNTNTALQVNDTSALGDENLTGLHAGTLYFALGINGSNTALGQNGNADHAIGINGSMPAGQVWDRGIYLAGTYG